MLLSYLEENTIIAAENEKYCIAARGSIMMLSASCESERPGEIVIIEWGGSAVSYMS